jgi:hypothetical protein
MTCLTIKRSWDAHATMNLWSYKKRSGLEWWYTWETLLRTYFSWIQSHPHAVILRHLQNMVNSFLCSSTNYFENWLLPNDLIIIRKHRDDEEDEWDIKRVLERQGDAHIKMEIQSNLKFQSLTSSPTRSTGSPWLQIDVQDAYEIAFGRSTHARKEDETKFPMTPVPGPTKIGFNQNCQIFLISRVQLIQELSTLKLMPRSHTTSNWIVLGLIGKVRR